MKEQILKFIETIRTSFIGSETVYTQGSCYQFYKILKSVFPQANAYYDSNHVITEIEGNFYDITGQVNCERHLLMDEHYPECFVKTAVYTSLPLPSSGLRWVRASENHPKDSDNYFVKVLDKDGDGYIFPAISCYTMGAWEVMEEHHEVTEWLCESASEVPGEWVKTKDKLPDFSTPVLGWNDIYERWIYTYEQIGGKDSVWGNWHDGKQLGVLPPTHWCYLPQPPTQ